VQRSAQQAEPLLEYLGAAGLPRVTPGVAGAREISFACKSAISCARSSFMSSNAKTRRARSIASSNRSSSKGFTR
jgi:hypothetical protein